MAESIVQVTEGVGKKLHTWDRTIGANTVQDEVVVQGESYLPTYFAQFTTVASATSADHIAQIMAGASLNVRIKRIDIEQVGLAGAVGSAAWDIIRITSAGTGGTAVTPQKADNGDAASGATAIQLPGVKGTEAAVALFRKRTAMVAAQPTGTFTNLYLASTDRKPLVIPAGTTNGIVIKAVVGVATVTWDVTIEFTETSFL